MTIEEAVSVYRNWKLEFGGMAKGTGHNWAAWNAAHKGSGSAGGGKRAVSSGGNTGAGLMGDVVDKRGFFGLSSTGSVAQFVHRHNGAKVSINKKNGAFVMKVQGEKYPITGRGVSELTQAVRGYERR